MRLRSKRSITAVLLAGALAVTGAACGDDDDTVDDVDVTEGVTTTGGDDATTTGTEVPTVGETPTS